MKTLRICFLLLILLSCSKVDPDYPGMSGPAGLSSIRVSASPPPLFADLGDAQTKGTPALVALDSVLVMAARKQTAFDGVSLVQIPFSEDYSALKAYFGGDPDGDPEEASAMKMFLVASDGEVFVVTMVADYLYRRSHPSFDYLNKPDYTGAVVFSSVSGELLKVQTYESGRILKSEFISDSQIDSGLSYIVVYSGDRQTKTSGAGDPVGMYTLSAGKDTWYWDPQGESPDLPEKHYTVDLSCDVPDEVEMTGNGTYTAGSTVVIGYQPRHSVKVFRLSYWTGDFAWNKSARFSHQLTGDIISTAYFETAKPCTNSSKGITNPLLSMRIAASNVSMALADADERIYANYYGGTFGETRVDRDGNPKRHDGLDLYAEVGTPVYAACSGTVTMAESGYGSEAVSGSYGNELRITTTERNKSFTVQYAHLWSEAPIAVNPRTGQPFRVDDAVFRGDLIGYTGRSGNAVDVPNPHLHYGIKYGGKWVDPKPYINGTYPVGKKSIDKGKGMITGIRRD